MKAKVQKIGNSLGLPKKDMADCPLNVAYQIALGVKIMNQRGDILQALADNPNLHKLHQSTTS